MVFLVYDNVDFGGLEVVVFVELVVLEVLWVSELIFLLE